MTEVEAPGQLPGACDPAAELDLAQMGDDDALAGLGSGVHFAWQEIQQLMDSATDEPLSDTLLEACANAALDGAPLHAGAPPPLLHLNEVSGEGDLSGHKRQWAATQPPAVIRPRPQAPPLMLSEHEQARRARRTPARAPTRAATLPHPVTDGVSSRARRAAASVCSRSPTWGAS